MELSELTSYAQEKYQIQEQHKWADFPGFSVLVHPDTNKWVALLMRQWDEESGEVIEICDLKCGRQSLVEFPKSYLNVPVRMHGDKWISVFFDDNTEKDVVYKLFDRALTSGEQRGYTMVLEEKKVRTTTSVYQDIALPFSGSSYRPQKVIVPEKIRQMRKLFVYGRESQQEKAENFVRQARFMQDYEDNYPWTGYFSCYYPTYHDLGIEQLRGYFSWRTDLRKGRWSSVPASAAYIYIYELLNGIGVSSPEETLEKMEEFRRLWFEHAPNDRYMQVNLRRWMLEYAVLKDLPKETVLRYVDPELLKSDAAMRILRFPEDASDEELFDMLKRTAGKTLTGSLFVQKHPEEAKRLFCTAFRRVSKDYNQDGYDFFTLLFGRKAIRRWFPLSNTVYLRNEKEEDRVCEIDECRCCRLEDGNWTMESYSRINFDLKKLQGFLHACDCQFRHYLKTGHYLRLKEDEQWAVPYIEAAISEDKIAVKKAARKEIRIDLSGLDRIRQDAWQTQNSLLIDEESEDTVVFEPEEAVPETEIPEEGRFDLPLSPLEVRVLRELLAGHPVKELLKNEHLMPSIVADSINGALFDEIGDTVLDCKEDDLSLVEDYTEEVRELLGGDIV
ncbi:MAG: TerB N-terminal domain-containing protein [Erysipelotrichaceae bacterium]|nr:TerB N-terminal domain-containing protein [Erysipelotrichaceae bacterium]